jgi:hypothetical protein
MKIAEKLRDLFVHGKDLGTSALLEHAVNKPMAPYGKIMDISLNSREKKITLQVLLKGESEVTSLTVEEYDLVEESDQTFLIVKKAIVSKEWLNVLVQEFLIGKKFPLPSKYARIIKLAL